MTDDELPAGYGPPPPIIAPPTAAPQPPYSGATSPHTAPAQGAPPQVAPYGAAAPQYGPPPGAPGWTPPPRPGLIPLAPLTFGTIIGAPYRLFRRNPRPTFGMSLLIQGGVLFITLAVVGLVAWATLSRVEFAASSEEEDQIVAGALGLTLLSALIPIALSLVATGIMQGIIVLEVSRQTLGEKLTFAQLWSRGKGRLWAVGWYSLALFGALGVISVIVITIAVVPFFFGDAGVVAGIILVIVLYLALLAGVLALATKLAFVPSAIVLERLGLGGAIARSWQLTRGSFWRILGTIVLVAVMLGFASQLVTTPISLIAGIVVGLAFPTGSDDDAVVGILIGTYGVTIVISLVVSAITLVVQSATTALLYVDQRIRREGLDLDLMRYVDARQAGAAGIRDPYESDRTRARA